MKQKMQATPGYLFYYRASSCDNVIKWYQSCFEETIVLGKLRRIIFFLKGLI